MSSVQGVHGNDPGHQGSLCIDDELSTYCHTNTQSSPWLSIRIPGNTSWAPASPVSHVQIYNRLDCCWDRLGHFQIWVGKSVGDYNSSTSEQCGFHYGGAGDQSGRPDAHWTVEAPATVGPFSFDCNQIVGWYVTIVLPGASRTLNLAEVRIFSTYESPSPPPP